MSVNDYNWLYVASNPSFPGLVKIGWTRNNPLSRLKDLDTTGVPEAFSLEYVACLKDAEELERKAHMRLDYCRVRQNREFFNISACDAASKIQAIAIEYGFKIHFENCNFIQRPWLIGLDWRDDYPDDEASWLWVVYETSMEKAFENRSVSDICKILEWTLDQDSIFPHFVIPEDDLLNLFEECDASRLVGDDFIKRFYDTGVHKVLAQPDALQCGLFDELDFWLNIIFESGRSPDLIDVMLNSSVTSVKLAAAVMLFASGRCDEAKQILRIELLNPFVSFETCEFSTVRRAASIFLTILMREREHIFDMALLKFASEMSNKSDYHFGSFRERVLRFIKCAS